MSGILDVADRVKAAGECAPRQARDPINQPMIHNWTEALGDENPTYREGFAPPAMIQVWTMAGLYMPRAGDDPLGLMMEALDAEGFTSVVATNCEQTYHRYLEVGEQLQVTTRLDEVVGPKQTGLGEGWFVTVRNTWYSGDEAVAEMLFRVLKFKPKPAELPVPDWSAVLRPVVSHDTAFFWEGTVAGELRIQHCPSCDTLRNPPGPMCMNCGADKSDYVVASGRGTVYSYVVHHAPPVPGKTLPFVVAVVELEEGVRMVAELVDADLSAVAIGVPVELALTKIDNDLTLPFWRLS